ncbi:hypothetical protein SPRG_10255 [Saprolegnia parasitica CBS 223.65]|uniref:RRM domain-containing protein n=1 Tax=Saprolegnia parasitica (strain CBS 223.65) TaxID=695850 RepID=A0A067CDX3_SAPPC|nr:hypothetical protein SPRG_10255 [Saprolegnia parasitica CBS 223.65]KDO24721.1 hypothetical protein SPRG_10255 [Saprolegnia parasitica CBS 223.65]|eukprot:XP_012204601.1 hypothetical protein SPRG_10255 [Saprolegnia parasitica CBS 223.65]
MSSLLNSLDMSLDDLIQKKKTTASSGNKGGRGGKESSGGAGPVRRGRANAGRGRSNGTPYGRKSDDDVDMDDNSNHKNSNNNKSGRKASILSRLGGKAQGQDETGFKIFVSNLKFDVLEDDIKELFSTVGKVAKYEILYDRAGRSKGQARVWFTSIQSAQAAINKYDGCTLDNQPMKITMDEGNARQGNNNSANKGDNGKNVRSGLFGTALKGATGKDVDFKVTFNGNGNGNRGGNGGRRNGGGGARRGRGGRGEEKSAADLDDDMDTYMNKN